jgi:hypothetical protein
MLTIQNINKILHKTLGKKNFYVARVEQDFDFGHTGYNLTANNKYVFELSNRKYAITVTLNRDGDMRQYKLTSSTNNVLYITKKDIRNLDIFLDKLRYVALG